MNDPQTAKFRTHDKIMLGLYAVAFIVGLGMPWPVNVIQSGLLIVLFPLRLFLMIKR